MSKTIKHFPPPSPLALGSLYVEKLLRVDAANDPPNLVVNRIISVLETTNLSQLKSIMTIIFQTLQDSSSSETQKSTAKQIIKEIIDKFQPHPHFRPHLIAFFDGLPNFPVNLLQNLPLESGIILTTYGCSSRYTLIASLFLKQKLLPSATKETVDIMSGNTLFEIASLGINNQFVNEKIKILPACFIPFIKGNGKKVVDASFQQKDRPYLYDAVLESDTRSLTNAIQLRRLFNFFPEFDANHAASFITSISSNKCCFRGYFSRLEEAQRERIIDLYRDSFIERGVDIKLIVSTLDRPNTPPLDNEGCSLLFSILQGLLRDKKIPGKPFLTNWQNRPAQLQFVTYLASNYVSGLSFDDCSMANLHGFEPPHIPNNCWLCLDFVKCVHEMSVNYPREITQLLSLASDQYSAPLLLSYSQIGKIIETDLFKRSSVSFISTVIMQARHMLHIVDVLWKTNNQFCCWLFSSFYAQYPSKLNSIIDSIGEHLHELLLHDDDLNFVIDLAFQASLRGVVEIGAFIRQLVARTSPAVLTTILEFVKSLVLDSSLSSPALFSGSLNAMFKYFWDSFADLSSDIKLLVNTVYSICDSSVPNIKKVPFADSLPSIRTPEVKESASELFTKFFEDQISVSQFVQIFHQHRVNSQTLFHSMEHFLLLELKYLDQHESQDVEKLGQLIGNMVHENLFNEKQLKNIFQVFVRAFGSNISAANYQFSVEALEICSPKLSIVPQAVFSLLKQPLLRTAQPQLYDKIKKLSTNLATPVHLSRSTALVLHPKLRKFEKLTTPPPRACKLIQQIPSDPTLIQHIINMFSPYLEWLALHLVVTVQDRPTLLQPILKQILESPLHFPSIVVQAAIFESIQLITNPQFASFEGAFARRRLSILGQLIGQLTLAVNQTIPGRFMDLRHLLLFAFSQGKLFGVIPFVSNILCNASSYFNPPNPYTSSILQVLSSIAMTDLLKLYEKNQIYQIFTHFNVSISQMKLLSLVPDVRQGNFDFIAPPFALNYILSVTDIDRIIQFDENVFSTLAAQNVIIPDPINPSQSRDKMRTSITTAALAFLKQEGTALAKVASSTSGDLILKDFMFSNNVELMQETAATLTKQLSAGLTLFTVFQKLQRCLSLQLLHDFGPSDAEWINATIQANFNWISQMLHDVVHLKALKIVQQKIEQNEELKRTQGQRYIEANAQSARNLPPLLAPCEQGLTVPQQQIYQDLAELPLSPAELSSPDSLFTGSSSSSASNTNNSNVNNNGGENRSVRPNDVFEAYFSRLTKQISTEVTQKMAANSNDPLADGAPINAMLSALPEMMNPSLFDEFLSVLRVMMKYMAKVTHSINDRIYGAILIKIVQKVPQPFVLRAQHYVVGWLRNSIPSVSLLCDMLTQCLVTTSQLDRFFFDSLNKQPFNYRLFVFAIRFLHFTLCESPVIHPSEMISSLTLVVSTPLSMLETATTQQEAFVGELRQVLDEMETPLNGLSADSKLQTMATFDPIEEIGEVDTIIASFNKWKNVVEDDNANDENVLKVTKEVFELGRDFFVVVLYFGAKEDIGRLLRCARECGSLKSCWEFIASAFEYCIGGNSMVLKYDMTKYFDALIALLNVVYDDAELLKTFAALLHCLRPLLMPSFAFSWIQLVSERHLVFGLVSNTTGWPAMTTLLADFVVAVSFAQTQENRSTSTSNSTSSSSLSSSGNAFELLYKSLLRFILVLVHDFSDFLAVIVPEIVAILPFSFSQLRNILLSAAPSATKLVPISVAIGALDEVPGIDEFAPILVPQKPLTEQLQFANAIQCESTFTELAPQLGKRAGTGAIASFIAFITNVLLPQSSISDILSPRFSGIHVYFIITQLVNKLDSDAIVILVNVIIDQLRFPCKSTLFFFKTALELLKNDIEQAPKILDELIIKTVIERAATPAPHPWGLRLLIRELMGNKEIRFMDRPFVKQSDEVQKFIKAIADAFCNDD